MFCHQCGNKGVEKAKFCFNCGTELVQPSSISSLVKTDRINNLNLEAEPKADESLGQQLNIRKSLEKAFTEDNWTRANIEELKKLTDTKQLAQLRNFLLEYERKEKPLHRSVWESKHDLTILLLDLGFDPYIQNKDGNDVFDLSVGDNEIRSLLLGYKDQDMLRNYIKLGDEVVKPDDTLNIDKPDECTKAKKVEIRNKSNKTGSYKPKTLVQENTSNVPSPVKLTVAQVLFSFQGRIGRSTFWIYALLSYLVFFAAIGLFLIFSILEGLAAFALVGIAVYIWVGFALMAKRWHDRNKSGWFMLLNLIPILGWLWAFIENGLLAGDESHNKYGPPEK